MRRGAPPSSSSPAAGAMANARASATPPARKHCGASSTGHAGATAAPTACSNFRRWSSSAHRGPKTSAAIWATPASSRLATTSQRRSTSRAFTSPSRPKTPARRMPSTHAAHSRASSSSSAYFFEATASKSTSASAATCTRKNRSRKLLGSARRPLTPPCGFCVAKRRKPASLATASPSSGTKSVPRWSRTAFSASSTGCGARFNSSNRTQLPRRSARSSGPSRHAKPSSAGRSAPTRSCTSLCSLRLMRSSSLPHLRASAPTSADFPTPGGPSSSTARSSWHARTTLLKFAAVVGASSQKSSPLKSPRASSANGAAP